MRVIITVVGKDTVGIISSVCAMLAEFNVNIVDISQTVLHGYFTMIMIADASECNTDFATLSEKLTGKGDEMGLTIRVQREDIFEAMHRI
jgi:ACT domain-containing protein